MADFNHAYIGNLVISAQSGSSEAFAELYATTYNHTYNYSMHYLRDAYLAQDAVQETYISALKNINNRQNYNICFLGGKRGEKRRA